MQFVSVASLGDLRPRAQAAALHLLISLIVAGFAASLVFGLWYPSSFRLLAGGQDLFFLITSVDVVLGPVLTFAIFNRAKGWSHLKLDLMVIGLVQTGALVYGLNIVYVARPVAMVFEVDRFQLVTAKDVVEEDLAAASKPYQQLSRTGPTLLGTRVPLDGKERSDALFKSLGGLDIGSRPIFWQPYDLSRDAAIARSRPVTLLLQRYLHRAEGLRSSLAGLKADEATSRFLPVVARGDWVAVLDQTGFVLGYLPLDGFF